VLGRLEAKKTRTWKSSCRELEPERNSGKIDQS